jgi:hypothetical protein
MADKKTGQRDYSTVNADEERDLGAKGGPTTSLGIADDAHDVPHPYDDDIQTQLAAKSTENKKQERKQ